MKNFGFDYSRELPEVEITPKVKNPTVETSQKEVKNTFEPEKKRSQIVMSDDIMESLRIATEINKESEKEEMYFYG